MSTVTDESATVATLGRPRGEEDAETRVAAAEGVAGPEVLTGKKEEEEKTAPLASEGAAEKAPEPSG